MLEPYRELDPDGGWGLTRRLLQVYLDSSPPLTHKLEQAIPAGETLRLDIDFTVRLPRAVARTGYAGSYYFVAQWFPKLGVWTDEGWNAYPFHGNAEFFADLRRRLAELDAFVPLVEAGQQVPRDGAGRDAAADRLDLQLLLRVRQRGEGVLRVRRGR